MTTEIGHDIGAKRKTLETSDIYYFRWFLFLVLLNESSHFHHVKKTSIVTMSAVASVGPQPMIKTESFATSQITVETKTN